MTQSSKHLQPLAARKWRGCILAANGLHFFYFICATTGFVMEAAVCLSQRVIPPPASSAGPIHVRLKSEAPTPALKSETREVE